MPVVFIAPGVDLNALGVAIASGSPPSSPPSSPDQASSLFSDAGFSSSSLHTEPDSSPFIEDNSSDEDNFTVYTDEEPDVEYIDRTQEDEEDFDVSELLPWPTYQSPPRSGRSDSWESFSSSELQERDRGYETDAEQSHYHSTLQRHRIKPARRRGVHYLVEHIQPVFELVVPFGPDDEIPPIPGVSGSSHDGDQDDGPDEGFQRSRPLIDTLTGDMDTYTESEHEDEPSFSGPQAVEYVVEHCKPIIQILPPITEAERAELARGLGLRLPGFDAAQAARLTRPATLTANGEIKALPVESEGEGEGKAETEQLPASTTRRPASTPVFGLGLAAARPPRGGLGRSPSFESVDLNSDVEHSEHIAAEFDVIVPTPATPDLRPWAAYVDSPSPIVLDSPLARAPFGFSADPLLPIPTAMQVAAREPMDALKNVLFD